MNWESKDLSVLGITLEHDKDMLLSKNYATVVDKIRTIIHAWRHRNPSIAG